MTGEVNERYLTPQERKARQMVKAVNEASPRNLPADAVVCPCENEHRPVYPVRYAYSNLFGDKDAKAAVPLLFQRYFLPRQSLTQRDFRLDCCAQVGFMSLKKGISYPP